MCRKIYIPTIEEYLAERAIKQSVVQSGKLTLLFSGQKIAIIPTGRYEYTHPYNTLCSGLILNRDGYEPFTAELNGKRILINSVKIAYTPKEYAVPTSMANRICFDWNKSIVRYGYYGDTIQYECSIDVDMGAEFDLTKIKYHCLHPISVQVGNKTYKYNKPLLVGINYNGQTYPVQPKMQPINKGWKFSKFNINDKYTEDDEENM